MYKYSKNQETNIKNFKFERAKLEKRLKHLFSKELALTIKQKNEIEELNKNIELLTIEINLIELFMTIRSKDKK